VTRHLAELLQRKFPKFLVSICILSEPLKEEYARINGLDAVALMSDGQAKEAVRAEMIEFGEWQRAKDSTIFCRLFLN
jgi:phosphomevalonate kinase